MNLGQPGFMLPRYARFAPQEVLLHPPWPMPESRRQRRSYGKGEATPAGRCAWPPCDAGTPASPGDKDPRPTRRLPPRHRCSGCRSPLSLPPGPRTVSGPRHRDHCPSALRP
ncbi:hypothetical protein [Alcanivorax sp.]|uniref:zinc finger domain-containing protein n=1 Tax=Alcanivorax sp. TaxID=1872427 RepID=UPI00344DDE90